MGHVRALDGFRGLAVLLVMWSHFIAVSPALDHGTVVGRLLKSGYYGVDMFFVLSGFLITGILLDAKGGKGYFKVFIMRRVLRIFPLYYAVLAVVYGGAWLFAHDSFHQYDSGPDSHLWFWAYASNWGMVVKGWGTAEGAWLITPDGSSLGHFWSLAVEEQFYLFWPWIVAWLDRRRLAWLCASFLVLAPVMASFLSDFAGNSLSGYVSTVGRLNTLGCGALLAIAARSPTWWARLTRPAGWVFAVSAVLMLVVLGRNANFSVWKVDALSVLVPLCFGFGLVHALRPDGGPWAALLASAPMRFLGKYSYGLYVYHHLLKPLWYAWFWHGWIQPHLGTGVLAVACYVIAAGCASVLLAMASWALLENPCLRLKRFFTYTSGLNPRA
jgi:peptidoglycan/LPS O-acetylase OafA/YrhL